MRRPRIMFAASAVAVAAFCLAPDARAATVPVTLDFAGPAPAPLILDPDSPGIVNGNCASNATKPCLGVNSQGAATLSVPSPLTFSVSSFWFQLLGAQTNLSVTTSAGTLTLLQSTYGHNNGGQVISVSGNPIFQNITSLSFLTNQGNARVDDLALSVSVPSPIPLPAPALMLLAGMGGLAFLRRRRKPA